MDVAESGGVVGRKKVEFRSRAKSRLCASSALVPYCEAFASRIPIEEVGGWGLNGMRSKGLYFSEVKSVCGVGNRCSKKVSRRIVFHAKRVCNLQLTVLTSLQY
jgi:hypothetical protein